MKKIYFFFLLVLTISKSLAQSTENLQNELSISSENFKNDIPFNFSEKQQNSISADQEPWWHTQVGNVQIKSLAINAVKIQLCPFADINKIIIDNLFPPSTPKDPGSLGNLDSNSIITVYKDNIVFYRTKYQGSLSIEIKDNGTYQVMVKNSCCSGLSQPFEVEFKKEISSSILSENTICEGAKHQLIVQDKVLQSYQNLVPVEIGLFKDSKKVDSISSQTHGYELFSFDLQNPGKYMTMVKKKFQAGECIYNGDQLNLKVNDTLLVGGVDKTLYSCREFEVLNLFNSNARVFLKDVTTDSWYKDGKPISGSGNSDVIHAKESGTYKFIAKNSSGCVLISPDFKLEKGKIDPRLVSTVEYDFYACNKARSWSLYGVNSNRSLDNAIINIYKDGIFTKQIKSGESYLTNAPGLYFAKVEQYGCNAETPILELKPFPAMPSLASSLNVSLCDNRPETIKVKNTATSTVIWEKDGELIFGQRDSLKISSPGNYSVFIIDSICTYKSGKVEIKSLILPKETNKAGEVSFCPGGENSLLKVLSPDSSVKYNLVKSNESIISNNSGIFTINEKGIYSINQQKGNCSISTNPVNFRYKIDDKLTLSDSLLCKGTILSITASNNPEYKYTWYQDGSKIEAAGINILKINSPGVYKVKISDKDCEAVSDEYKIALRQELTANLKGDATIDFGKSTKLTVNFTSTPPYIFNLNNGLGQITTSANPYSFDISPQISTQYKIEKVSNICGEGKVSGSANVKVIILSIEKENKIRVFPNPATERIFIDAKNENVIQAQVFNAFGKLVLESNSNFSNGLKISDLSSGIYTINVVLEGSKVETFKIIKY